eukprot:2655147-Pyramimonas_sp.AAC.1
MEAMAGAPLQFFSSHQPAPLFCHATDVEAKKRIDKLVEYVHKNGPQFEQMVKMKQGSDPQYAFLFGGPDYPYYRWALWCQVYNLNRDVPPGTQATPMVGLQVPGSQAQPMMQGYVNPAAALGGVPRMTAAPVVLPPTLPPDLAAGFNQVMDALNATKDSIQAARNWFMQGSVLAEGNTEGMMAMMMERSLSLLQQGPMGADRQLQLVYLANDILFQAQRKRTQPADWVRDPISRGFRNPLAVMLAAVKCNSTGNP